MEKYKNYKIYWSAVAFLAVSLAGPVVAQDTDLGETMIQLAYSLDTFYFLMSGALVMWMAAGFTMLESGLVRAKNTVEILTKNVALYSIACIMYMIVGYNIMYGDGVNGLIPGLSFFLGADNTVDEVLKSGGDTYYSNMSDFFFQVVFFATAMSIVSGAVAERMKLWSFLLFAVVMTGLLAVAFTNPEGSIVAQLIGIVSIFSWCFATSFIVWLIIKVVMGIRVTEEEELEGVDVAECGLAAYPEFTKD